MATRPRIVCLCGSTRFVDAFTKANRDETLAGRIVLSVGMFGHQEGIDMEGTLKKELDELHLRSVKKWDGGTVVMVIRIDRRTGFFEGGADPRGDGAAMGF